MPFDAPVIEQMLNPHGNPCETAMELLQRHSGVAHVGFAAPDDAPPAGDVSARVAWLGRTFGHLHAPPPATANAMRPWADWLARWHALYRQSQDLWFMAMRDELTGAWNRRYFNRFLRMVLDRARGDGSAVTLMLFDIDDFKQYNDRYGHPAGDEILRETAKLMQAMVREHDVVARIGGDEFAVIFWDAEAPRRSGSQHPDDVAKVTRRFQKAIRNHRFPKLANEAPGTLTISGGLAAFPDDGETPDALLEKADAMTLHSKQHGKNAITFGPGSLANGEV